MWTILLNVIIVVIPFLVLWYGRIFSFKGLWELPRPILVPFIGHTLSFIRNFRGMHEFHGNMLRLQKEIGGLFVLWNLAMKPYVMIADEKLTEYFLSSTKHITKAMEYKMYEPWLGKGLLTSTGTKWHKRRKLLTPAFHFKILDEFTNIINKNGNILIEKLSRNIDSDFDIYPFMKLYALDVICETAMGTSINAQMNEEHTEYVMATKEFLQIVYNRVFSIWEQFPLLYHLFSSGPRNARKQIKILHKFTRSVIEKRRQELLDRRNKGEDCANNMGKRKMAFLDLLLQTTQDGEPLTDEDIREEVDTFMFEGHDTVSSALSFIIFELTKHEDIQRKLLKEIEEILGTDIKVQPSITDLQNMNYLELVIKEGLRLYPPVPVIERGLEEDAIINNVTYTKNKKVWLPRGSTVVINVHSTHLKADVFAEPEKFIPERFIKENITEQSPYAYLPFSAGPRNCIGQKFAMLEMKATLVKLIRAFKLHPVQPFHKPIIYSDTILKSYNGLPIRLKHRV